MTETVIRKAEMTDLHQDLDLYRLLCDQQAGDPYTPEWVFGLHPDEEMLADHVRRQELWIAENGQQLQAAMALVPEGGSRRELGLHLLGIIKSARGSGLAQRMMDIMEEEARKGGYQAQVLDVIPGNLPAEKLYRRNGFGMADRFSIEEGGRILRFHLYRKEMAER